jgi:hypothetical protein
MRLTRPPFKGNLNILEQRTANNPMCIPQHFDQTTNHTLPCHTLPWHAARLLALISAGHRAKDATFGRRSMFAAEANAVHALSLLHFRASDIDIMI